MKEVNCLTAVFYLETEKNLSLDIIKEIGFGISSKKSLVEKKMNRRNVKEIIGLAEHHSILNIGLILFLKEDEKDYPTEFDERNYLIRFLKLSEFFCQALWMVKDNSVHYELGHLFYEANNSLNVHSNMWNSSYSTSVGTVEPTYFNKAEIVEAINILPAVISINLLKKPLENESVRLTSKISRLSRAFYFLTSARNTDDIGTKISIYCSVLESLFSISNSELRHRLSETVSFFLENEYGNKIKLYKILKLAYDIRSSVVHGDGLSSKFLKSESKLLLSTAKDVDDIIRRCFRKIISDEFLYELFTEKDKDEIGLYFQELIFK